MDPHRFQKVLLVCLLVFYKKATVQLTPLLVKLNQHTNTRTSSTTLFSLMCLQNTFYRVAEWREPLSTLSPY